MWGINSANLSGLAFYHMPRVQPTSALSIQAPTADISPYNTRLVTLVTVGERSFYSSKLPAPVPVPTAWCNNTTNKN